jgi:hypothetical protein
MRQKTFGASSCIRIIENLLTATTTMLTDLTKFFHLAES